MFERKYLLNNNVFKYIYFKISILMNLPNAKFQVPALE